MANIDNFELFLRQENMSENTISAYRYAVSDFFLKKKELTKRNLLSYKTYLMENFRPKTVNLRIQALNKYLEFSKHSRLRLKSVKVQQKSYLENVISNEDYLFFKNKLKKESNAEWYFIVRYLAATGARVSELVQIKIEHINAGHIDIYGKGGKFRRIFIPKKLREETDNWLSDNERTEGYLFLNRFGKRITTRGVSQQLKNYAVKYGLNPKVVYPHSFRHRFAKNFLDKYNDIALLADLMGHESIETTRIYLRKSTLEQQAIVDKVITSLGNNIIYRVAVQEGVSDGLLPFHFLKMLSIVREVYPTSCRQPADAPMTKDPLPNQTPDKTSILSAPAAMPMGLMPFFKILERDCAHIKYLRL